MLAAAIGAAGNIIGGLMGFRDKDKDRQKQKEFAQNAIQWKVSDARKAGVHPLYALGAQTNAFAPVSVGGTDLGAGIAAAGQDVSRAVAANSSTATKASAYQSTVEALTVQRMGLENQLLGSQIAKINQTGVTPPAPSPGDRYLLDGQGNSPLINVQPMSRTTVSPSASYQEPGALPDVGFAKTGTGGYAPVMSHDVKQRLEEDPIGMLMWNFRNRLLPTVGLSSMPPADAPFPPGRDYWLYDPFSSEYRAHRSARPPRYPYRGPYRQ